LQAGGREFEPRRLHQPLNTKSLRASARGGLESRVPPVEWVTDIGGVIITGSPGPGRAKKPGRMASPVGDAQYTVRAAGNNWPQVGVISPPNPAPNPQC
jgi:hypothetical protein